MQAESRCGELVRTHIEGSPNLYSPKLPEEWIQFLKRKPETGMGYQIVSVVLEDGRKFDQVVISESALVTRVRGCKDIPFSEFEIKDIRVTHKKWDWNKEHSQDSPERE